eukprot:7958844-Pyramimonas_sp.AAC.1
MTDARDACCELRWTCCPRLPNVEGFKFCRVGGRLEGGQRATPPAIADSAVRTQHRHRSPMGDEPGGLVSKAYIESYGEVVVPSLFLPVSREE